MLSFMTKTSHSNNLQTLTTGLVGKPLLTTIRVVSFTAVYTSITWKKQNTDMLLADMEQQFSEDLSRRSAAMSYLRMNQGCVERGRVTPLLNPSRKAGKVNLSGLRTPSRSCTD